MTEERVIVHCDVDAFYVACELSRRPELKGIPVAVSQFNSGGFVAVSHEARRCGVRKGDGIGAGGQASLAWFKDRPDALMPEVRKRCPNLVVLPMDTDFYRAKSAQVRKLLKQASWAQYTKPVVEQSSMDDFYLDITEEVVHRLNASHISSECNDSEGSDHEEEDYNIPWTVIPQSACFSKSIHASVEKINFTPLDGVIDSAPLHIFTDTVSLYKTSSEQSVSQVDARSPESEVSPRIQIAVEIVASIKENVCRHTGGLTLSCGIASNKILARLVSKRPGLKRTTTVLLEKDLPCLLRSVPLSILPGFKGRLGKELVSKFGPIAIGDLPRNTTAQELDGLLGPKLGKWLWMACSGVDLSPVIPNETPKSLLVERSFPATKSKAELETHVLPLCMKLLERATFHLSEYAEFPKCLVVGHRFKYENLRSKRISIPHSVTQKLTAKTELGSFDKSCDAVKALAAAATSTIVSQLGLRNGDVSITRVALTFTKFQAIKVGASSVCAMLHTAKSRKIIECEGACQMAPGSAVGTETNAKRISSDSKELTCLEMGWDEAVFSQLPQAIQKELVSQSPMSKQKTSGCGSGRAQKRAKVKSIRNFFSRSDMSK